MKSSQDKVIISCAVTGSVHTPTMSEYLPLTPDQIAEQAVEAAQAGAAILHLHARDPRDGRPTADPAVFDQFVPRIRDATDAVINITTGGSTRMTLEERLAYPLRAKPEMCSLNMGSMNFSIHPAARRISQWRHDWEKPYVEGMEDLIFRNTFRDIRHILKVLGEECGTRFEFECYDLGHLYNLAHFVDEGLVQGPLFIQSIYGILGGMGPDPENLATMKTTADRLFGRGGYRFSVLGAGRHQLPLVTMGAIMGGNVRVGLEDSLYLGKGQLAKSCAEQVSRIRLILEALSLEVATPAEARVMLGLKGRDAVGF
ncbi:MULTISPECIES: 3-keto-5-aminohexanoate cleavage protein [Achromobacter]|uniref:3-keto-5-aminohexanoate cleavage protein n=1 Tax=Achromobacter denitrificans TaxID=32002 RepID=A0A3R9ML30_ACHDE|nr:MULTISPECIES: 3-keto-5-aminohexanoate cleavage protein [Achromobacter]MDF3850498.1 3-keto-5-aminohexanoate cleavage protein [Achromobacter denitrificans]MDF3858843.1 3-keto-5-aminohexanoate cleavage protein [Achromobacter denitrificans]MDF3939772.1 3-keto-5-aminohexanoate cleavage protein [Achromobacter denitrificans]OLU06887.1 3-keto-5-aminohexanoate cleavage protein [Achromobacter denitrificans]QCS62643.1 3-keto-5-aminohexanoate cleavage protein [Achromobacter denitrificans]